MNEPTDSGEVSLNTRSMCRNRSGRPRSWTRSDRADHRAAGRGEPGDAAPGRGRSVSAAPSASSVEAPASPPRNRYSGTSGVFHVGVLMIGRP